MTYETKLIIFLLASFVAVWLSWNALRNFKSHGFYRFFAWELIIVLILMNIDYWFKDPFSVLQIISWFFLSISLLLVLFGGVLLLKLGKPDKHRPDPALIGFEKTTQLVTVGIYRYIRHPIYGSLVYLTWGVALKQATLLIVFLAIATTVFLVLTSKIEEAENIAYFGQSYRAYIKKSKMFIPFLF